MDIDLLDCSITSPTDADEGNVWCFRSSANHPLDFVSPEIWRSRSPIGYAVEMNIDIYGTRKATEFHWNSGKPFPRGLQTVEDRRKCRCIQRTSLKKNQRMRDYSNSSILFWNTTELSMIDVDDTKLWICKPLVIIRKLCQRLFT